MKLLALILTAAALAACQKPTAENAGQPPENGAQYKKDKGLALTDAMKKAIALKVAEVEETKVAPSFTVALHVMADGIQRVAFSPTAKAASGWLTAEQAALVKTGMEVELRAEAPGAPREAGVVKRVEKAPYQMLGDFEVTVESTTPLETGARVLAIFHALAGEAVTAIPRSALLKTAEGHFVYALNGEFYVRTPVKVGAVKVSVASPLAVVAATDVGAPGTATITLSETDALAELDLAGSVGVNNALKVCVPTLGIEPLAGL